MTLQKYEDVDLIAVSEIVTLNEGVEEFSRWWYFLLVLAALIIIGIIYFLFRNRQTHDVQKTGPELPSSLTPVTLLAFLKKLSEHEELNPAQKGELQESIGQLQASAFGPSAIPPNTVELHEIASHWQKNLTHLNMTNPATNQTAS